MILPVTEVRRITGYQRPSAQVRWLRKHGWKFTVNALGEPVVAVAEFNRKLVGGRVAHQEPDFGALNGTQA
jgi:hypothetical protein